MGSNNESWHEETAAGSSKKMGSAQLATAFLPPPIFLLPQQPALCLSHLCPDPEKNISNTSPKTGLRLRHLVRPAEWGMVSRNVPGQLRIGRMRFGEDSMIATVCESTRAQFSRSPGISVTFSGRTPLCLDLTKYQKPINLEIFHSNQKES